MIPPTIKSHPIGAIKSIPHLQSILDEGEGIELFYVHGLGRSSSLGEGHFTTKMTVIAENYLKNIHWRNFKDHNFSLLDCNVIELNSYNDHFLFDNRRLAERYLAECKANIAQEQSYQEHLRWCKKIFRDYD